LGVDEVSEKSKSDLSSQNEHKNIAIEYFELVSAGNFKEGLHFFSADCKTHNPFVSGSIENLVDAMIAASKDLGEQNKEPKFAVKHILADGNLVAVHTEFLNSKSEPSEGGLRQVHLFRFEGDKIVEYWDITQQVLSDMPNARGAF
jgi:predicted SnoaL-like aldol condensation-catalyzing enzyme